MPISRAAAAYDRKSSVTNRSGAKVYFFFLIASGTAPTYIQQAAAGVIKPYRPHGCGGADLGNDPLPSVFRLRNTAAARSRSIWRKPCT